MPAEKKNDVKNLDDARKHRRLAGAALLNASPPAPANSTDENQARVEWMLKSLNSRSREPR